MAKSATFESDFLKLIFNAVNIANLADNTVTSPLTNLYLALHTADPGSGGVQSTNEVAYTGYARVAVARTTGGFTISGSAPTQAALAATCNFPLCTALTSTATFFSVGVAASGATKILYSGSITPSIVISNGVTPSLTTGTVCTEL